MQERLRRVIVDSRLAGEFLLSSGEISQEYFDLYERVISEPGIRRLVAQDLNDLLLYDETDFLAGVPRAGDFLATELSSLSGKPLLVLRDTLKPYGTRKTIEGPSFFGKRVCLIEGVTTTGGSILRFTKVLRDNGALVSNALAVVLREVRALERLGEEGVKLQFLSTRDDLIT